MEPKQPMSSDPLSSDPTFSDEAPTEEENASAKQDAHKSTDDGWETYDSENDLADFASDSGLGTEYSTPSPESHAKTARVRPESIAPFPPAPQSSQSSPEPTPNSVQLLHIVEPLPGYPRVLTVVLLHANGSSGAELKYELLESTKCSSGKTLREELPGLRWIFPNAPMQDHVRSNGNTEKCRMWLDPCIHDPAGGATSKMFQGLKRTMDVVKDVIAAEGVKISDEEENFDCHTGWEREEIVFGGYWHGSAPAACTWICSELNIVGFMGIRGVLPDNEVRKRNLRRDILRGKPPGPASDTEDGYIYPSEFYRRWSCSMIRSGRHVVENIASTPVLLTLHENDTHWLVDSVDSATTLYESLIGPSDMMVIRSFKDHLRGAKDGIHVRELDIIREYLNNLVASKANGDRHGSGVWKKGETHPSRIRSRV
ncbi:hypothetical protein VTL71DRAFT_15022 [Oculimacula yallundae]|uniref:Uncharacterized protein n=1 Tax=Oculimacula yallundae TaxID=86028 RepID=A0ABR4CG30_9HELO